MKKLLELLQDIKGDVDFEKEKNLVEDGILDSLEIAEIVIAIEKAYNIEINPDDIDPDNFQTMESMWGMIVQTKR